MLGVVRRDNNQCQICGRTLKDSDIEFDHIIPISKGGSSEENNIRVTCLDCNRNKSCKIVV
ncbi:MAG: HNH endonuclease [Euryarchaeota archaeon]|nr:HNH endonuclease [Euryarchaeota archaeon]MBU4138579.1 HNH endonuclease [Euryarchaeota archaeon]